MRLLRKFVPKTVINRLGSRTIQRTSPSALRPSGTLLKMFRKSLPVVSLAGLGVGTAIGLSQRSQDDGKDGQKYVGSIKFNTPVYDWIHQAGQAMGRNFSPQEVNALALMIKKESGGDPKAINKWDSNWRKGTPSKGLIQTIDPTFNRWKLPGHGNVYNPIDNIIAGVRYAEGRYGNLLNVPGVKNAAKGKKYVGY